MNSRVEDIVEKAKVLSPDERGALLEALSELVNPADEQWQQAREMESEEHLVAYEQGKIEAEDFDVVLARLRGEFLAG